MSKKDWKFDINEHIRYHLKKPRLKDLSWTLVSAAGCRLTIYFMSKLVGNVLNRTGVHNLGTFHDAMENRNGRGLITVANHTSRLDDPLMFSVLRWNDIKLPRLRWSTAAEDICFKSSWESKFMALGKVLPVTRGAGVMQKSMDFCVKELMEGKWVHMFPEGKINLEQKPIRLKWGVGRLIVEPSVTPLVLLIHHVGFEKVFPNGGPLFPRLGQKTSIYFSEKLDFTKEVEQMRSLMKTPDEMRKIMTDVIQAEMAVLKLRAEQFHKQYWTTAEEDKNR
ncbi:tafazzin-like [Dreissena polymorpha]|uniref:tafazzin-like n=1 Tax=Dreissena polymorpha TaxID=45954 RepID=UPI002263E662|nr:tafazzin-like [Dreissena polymorpha]